MTSRRQFLGAAAVLAGLSTGDAAADETADGVDEAPPRPPVEQPDGYPRTTEHGGFFGVMDVPEYDDAMSITVGVHPNQSGGNIDIDVTFCGMSVGPAIDPDEARELGRTLIDAADDVEEWQAENITDEQREHYW